MQLVETISSPLVASDDKTLSGLFAELETFNQNGRKYPTKIYEQAYEELIPKIQDRRLLGELDHPLEYDEIRLSNVSHVITDCSIAESNGIKKVYGTLELLDTPAGQIAQSLVKAGVPLGVSSRGIGSTKNVREGSEVTQLKLITYDLVAEPSFANAILSPRKSKELSDSLNYIESNLPMNESLAIENNNIKSIITNIRESLILKETSQKDEIDIDRVEVDCLRNLLESTHNTIQSDTELLESNRKSIKQLQKKLEESEEKYKYVIKNMFKLQESYNELKESSVSTSEVEELNETIIELRKQLAVEKRGMSYSQVSDLLEGAIEEREIEDKLNSLSSLNRKRQYRIVSPEPLTESASIEPKKLTRLATIISQV